MGSKCCQDNSDMRRNEMYLANYDESNVTWKDKNSAQNSKALKPEDNPFYGNSPKIIGEHNKKS